MGPVRRPAQLQHCHHHQELGYSNIFSSFCSQQICGEGSREKKGSCSTVESGNVRRTHPTPTGVRGRRVGQNLQKMFALFPPISAVKRLGSDQRMSPHHGSGGNPIPCRAVMAPHHPAAPDPHSMLRLTPLHWSL